MPDKDANAVTDEVCPKGLLSCQVRLWQTEDHEVKDMDASCYACDSEGRDCLKEESADMTASGKGVVAYDPI